MKRNLLSLFLVCMFAMSMLTFTGCTRIGPGYVGIVVHMAGDQKGVQDFPTTTGWTTYNPISESVLEFPIFTQTAVWTRNPNEGHPINEEIAYQSVEGMVITSDISFSYNLDAAKVPALYVKFRTDNIDNFTHGYLRNIARDAFNEVASKMKIDDIYGNGRTDLVAKVKAMINAQVSPYGVQIEQFGFVGEQRLPDNVVIALNNKIAMTQQAEQAKNAVAKAEADAQSVIAKARGESEANRLLASSISPQLIAWRQLDVLSNHWDGHLSAVVGGGGNGLGILVTPPTK